MEQQHYLTDITVDATAQQELRQIAKWGKFLSIVGFIMCGLLLLAGVAGGSLFSSLSRYGTTASPMGGAAAGVIIAVYCIAIALIYFFPVLYLYQSSTKMKGALDASDQQTFNESLIKMKACFRYVGVLTIIVLSLYAVILVLGIIAAAMR